ILTSDISFARTTDLAKIYNVPTWSGRNSDGTFNSDNLVRFDGKRAGLFTRAAFLFSGRNEPNAIIRGARIRTEYLCDELVVPADTSTPSEVVLPATGTHRQIYAARTQTPGTACAACHETQINPLGFSLMEFDALGRYRNVEPLFNPHTTPESKVGWT